MKKILPYILIVVLSFVGVFAIYNFVPLKYFEVFNKQVFGSSVTTINGSDTLSSSRTVINNNFSSLNTDVNATLATTSMNGITTLNNLATAGSLATVGTITSGTWNGTTITVAKGGTGSTTLSQFHVLLGSSTNAVGIVSGVGTDGQFLTSQGAGLPPQWETSAIDQAGNYAWTGTHSFSNSFSIFNTGTSTISKGLEVGYLIGAPFFNATSTTATSTFRGGIKMDYATTTNLTISGSCVGCVKTEIKTNTCNLTGGAGTTCTATVACSAGYVVVGGGYNAGGTPAETVAYQNAPNGTTNWEVSFRDTAAGDNGTETAYAICVNP